MKAIEKAMQRAWCDYRRMEYVEGHVCPLPSDNFEKGYLHGRMDALADQWRSVKNELPDSDDNVLVAYKSHYADSTMYGIATYDGKWFSEDDNVNKPAIFAWMPIPKLPYLTTTPTNSQTSRECKHYGADGGCHKHSQRYGKAHVSISCKADRGEPCGDYDPKP